LGEILFLCLTVVLAVDPGRSVRAQDSASDRASTTPANRSFWQYRDKDGVLHVTNVDEAGGRARVVRASDLPRLSSRHRHHLPTEGNEDDVRARGAKRYGLEIRHASELYSLPPALIYAVMHTESRFFPRAVSSAGAMGLMQLMPATARWLGVSDAFDPRENIHGGARFLRLLANRFGGDMVLVLAAYHAGAGAVKKYGGVPPYASTRAYVRAVLRRYYEYQALEREVRSSVSSSADQSLKPKK
jgi:soluble lytic murein transglycosylase-like protein